MRARVLDRRPKLSLSSHYVHGDNRTQCAAHNTTLKNSNFYVSYRNLLVLYFDSIRVSQSRKKCMVAGEGDELYEFEVQSKKSIVLLSSLFFHDYFDFSTITYR